MRRFYVYSRVSTLGKQAENTSQHVQLAACKAYGEENGFIFVDHIHDSQSGTDWDSRKGIQELKRVIQSGEITDVIFFKIDRSGRDSQIKEFIRFIYENGVKVSIAQKNRTYETSYACIQDCFWEIAVSEYERNAIVERTMSGKLFQFQNGGIIKRPIAGYDTRKITKEMNGKVIRVTEAVINPQKAEAIRLIFRTFIETQSEAATVRTVNIQFPDLIQKKDVLRRNMKSILSNAMTYAGLPVSESFNGNNREFKFDPILDIDTASKTMAYLAAYSRKRNDNVTPLAGIVKCTCKERGKATYAKHTGYESTYGFQCVTNETYRRLKVLRAESEKPKCSHNVRLSYILGALDSFFEENDEQNIMTKFEAAFTKQLDEYNTRVSNLSRLKNKRTELEEKKSKIMETVLQLSINPEFSSLVQNFSRQIADIDPELKKVTESIRKVSESVSQRQNLLIRLGLSTEPYERPVAKKLDDGTVSVTYDGETHLFGNVYAYQNSDIRTQMRADLYNNRMFENLDGLNNRIAKIRKNISEKNWEMVNPALKELGIWITVPFAQTDVDKRRTGIRVSVDFSPQRAAIEKA